MWEGAWGQDAPNSVVGQLGMDNSAMGRGEVGTMHGKAGRQGNVRGKGVPVENLQVQGQGTKISRGGALGNGIPAPHVGSVDGRSARVDNSEDDANTEECIPATQVRHHQMYALAHSIRMMPPNHQPRPQFASMFPKNHFLGFRRTCLQCCRTNWLRS